MCGIIGVASSKPSVDKLLIGLLRQEYRGYDSAGLAISTRLTSEARGLDMAARNSADAQAMINTIESAHNEIHNILQRMRELAVQGANDTNGSDDRTNIRTELRELHEEIDAIKNQTKWAGQTLISGASTFTFQIGNLVSNFLDFFNVALFSRSSNQNRLCNIRIF